jgi:glycosyltransferase involved in cell wall biosynthesis
MRIVHVESGRHLYGGARQVAYLIEALAGRGLENALVCPPGHALTALRARAAVREVPMGGDLDLGMLPRLRRAFTDLDPDIVHVHSRRGADFFGGRACERDGRAALLTRRVDNPEVRAWARFKYRPYRAIVAISRAVREELCGRGGLDPRRVATIASGVDAQAFRPDGAARARVLREFALADDAFVVGVVAQLIPRKGHELLLRCLPDLVRRVPRLYVLCCGRGPLRARLQRRVAAAGLTQRVRFVGFRADLALLLPGFDLLVHPAAHEGLGVAILEAMSCEVPVVATAVGGVVDAVGDGREGLLVPWGDAVALTAAVERLSGEEPTRRRMGAAGRIRVQREFSTARMADRYVELYRDVAAGR